MQVETPPGIQTKITDPVARRISLKLPLEQPRFHWTFYSRRDFLAGKLVVRITRAGATQEIVIFEAGVLGEGWEPMQSDSIHPGAGEVYFGFMSTTKYPTAPGDNLEIELSVPSDLPGVGSFQAGVLPRGLYRSTGSYSLLVDEYEARTVLESMAEQFGVTVQEMEANPDFPSMIAQLEKNAALIEFTAFMECWRERWPLTITAETGWLPAGQRAMLMEAEQRAAEMGEFDATC